MAPWTEECLDVLTTTVRPGVEALQVFLRDDDAEMLADFEDVVSVLPQLRSVDVVIGWDPRGDGLADKVARILIDDCSRLETIRVSGEGYNSRMNCASLVALVRRPTVRDIYVERVDVGMKTLVQLLEVLEKEATGRRLKVNTHTTHQIRSAVYALFEHLTALASSKLRRVRLDLQVQFAHGNMPNAAAVRELTQMSAQIKHQHAAFIKALEIRPLYEGKDISHLTLQINTSDTH